MTAKERLFALLDTHVLDTTDSEYLNALSLSQEGERLKRSYLVNEGRCPMNILLASISAKAILYEHHHRVIFDTVKTEYGQEGESVVASYLNGEYDAELGSDDD